MATVRLDKGKGIVHWTYNNESEGEGEGEGEDKELYREFLAPWEADAGWQGRVKETATGITLTATTIRPLKELIPMEYGQVEKMLLQLGAQMRVLKDRQKGISCFTLDDIRVIDDEFFLITGLQNVTPIRSNTIRSKKIQSEITEQMVFTNPVTGGKDATPFLAPELKEKLDAKVLPFTTTPSVGYYSLAKLALACLQLETQMEALQGSKMYYCLERCLQTDPAKRVFLYV